MNIIYAVVALGMMGLGFGVVLAVLDKKLRIQEDSRIQKILAFLPGLNCGACGFASCEMFSQKVVEESQLFKGCVVGGREVNEKVGSLLGIKAKEPAPFKIVVLCGADNSQKKSGAFYRGLKSCVSLHLNGGGYFCKFGCLGGGDCVEVCPTQALKIKDGLVRVDYSKCIGCGACCRVCPRGILVLVSFRKNKPIFVVSCNNPEEAATVRKICSAGCIGCGVCTKVIKDSPFYLEGKISRLDYEKAKRHSDLDLPLQKCPTKTINKFDV